MTIQRMVELFEIEHQCILRNINGECDRRCNDCDLVQDDAELNEMYTEAVSILKAQMPCVMTLEEIKSAELCWIEDRILGMLYAATYECRGNPSNRGQFAVFKIQVDEDDLPEEYADDDEYYFQFMEGRRWLWEGDMNDSWRAWTSKPTDEQRRATPWSR